jgi:hypothetical protein
MIKKVIWFVVFCLSTVIFTTKAQRPLVEVDSVANSFLLTSGLDSAGLVVQLDTISPKLLLKPDSLTQANLADSLSKGFGFPVFNIDRLIKNYISKDTSDLAVQMGDLLPKGDVWVLVTIVALLLIFAILNQTFSKQLLAIVQAFFSNRALSNLNKEDNAFNSWPFLILFAQFGFTIGMFFYLAAQFKELSQVQSGFSFYVTISFLIIAFYGLKIIVLKLLGFIFDISKPIGEYISILYLSYFNASLLFMPLVLAFALSPPNYGIFYIAIASILLAIIFVFQFIRAGINILSNYRFPKVYLILYFCTLEICPMLILIKVIGF